MPEDLNNRIDDQNDIANLAPNDVFTTAKEVQDEDDLESEAAPLTTTRRSISAEDSVTEEMEEDLDNESADFKKELQGVGDEWNEEELEAA